MALEQWANVANRNGTAQRTPPLPVPVGATHVFMQLDVPTNSAFMTDASQKIEFAIYWSAAPGPNPPESSFQHWSSGTFDGAAPPGKGGVRWEIGPSELPPGCTFIAAVYTVVNGPTRFGVLGEFT